MMRDRQPSNVTRISRRHLLRLALGVGAALALAACGQSAPQPSPAPTTAPAAARPAAQPTAGTAPAKRRLRIGNSFAASNLNPRDNGFWLNSYGAAQTLYYVNPDESLRPWIASSIERSGEDGWTIKLNPAAKFHNGKVIDAKAVQASIERHLEGGVGVPSLKGAKYEVVDARTLQIKTSTPDAWLPYYFADGLYFTIFDTDEVPPKADPASLIGKAFFSGMFRVKNLTPEELTLDAAADAWDGAPKLAGVDVRFVKDPQARLAALKTGEIDMMLYVPSDAVPQIRSTPGLAFKKSSESSSRIYVNLNHRRPVTGDVAVRRALALAIDRKQIAEKVLNGAFDAPDGLYPPSMPWYVPGLLRTDAAEAKKILDEAGWAPGQDGIRKKGDQRLAFELLHYPQQPDSKPMAEAMQAQLKAVGMEVKIKQVDDVNAAMKSKEFDAALAFNSMQSVGNPMAALDRYFLTDSVNNYGGWGSAELDGLIKKLRSEFDTARRVEMLKQVQQIFMRDVPITFTVSRPWAVAVNAAFGSYVPTPMVDHYIVTKETAPAGQ